MLLGRTILFLGQKIGQIPSSITAVTVFTFSASISVGSTAPRIVNTAHIERSDQNSYIITHRGSPVLFFHHSFPVPPSRSDNTNLPAPGQRKRLLLAKLPLDAAGVPDLVIHERRVPARRGDATLPEAGRALCQRTGPACKRARFSGPTKSALRPSRQRAGDINRGNNDASLNDDHSSGKVGDEVEAGWRAAGNKLGRLADNPRGYVSGGVYECEHTRREAWRVREAHTRLHYDGDQFSTEGQFRPRNPGAYND